MIITENLNRALTITALVLVGACGWGAYKWSYDRGARAVQSQWDRAKQTQQDAVLQLQASYRAKEARHAEELQQVTRALSEGELNHEKALADLRAQYDQRLQRSVTRADSYQRQAEAGPAQCRDLAGHAARLDRSLEEGRSLVWELRTTLGQRDEQLKLLGTQLLNDRVLVNDDN